MCPYCSTSIPDGLTFCPNCGELYVAGVESADPVVRPRRKRGPLVLVGVGVLFAGVAMAITGFLADGGDAPAAAESITKPTMPAVATTVAPEEIGVDDMMVGDCLQWPEGDTFTAVLRVDCAVPHDLEVHAVIDLREISYEYSSVADFPGSEEIYDIGFDVCVQEFESYVGVPYSESAIYLDVFTPTESGWIESGDRVVDCVIYSVDSDTEQVRTTGSLRGAGI